MDNIRTVSISGTTEYVHSAAGQLAIKEFTDMLRQKAGTPEAYLALCQTAERKVFKGPYIWVQLLEVFKPLIAATPPGHDPGHIRRDLLASFALANDPFVTGKAAFQSDVLAGMLGGCFHDIGNAVTHRYQDTERMAGHAEIGAWVFYQFTENIIVDEALRIMASYAIAAHTHYLKPLEVKDPAGFVRDPYPYGLREVEGGKYVGFGPILTRFADRLDTNGVTLLCRHLLANADAVESGQGMDITGDQFYEIKKDEFNISLLPEVRGTPSKPPTSLEHIRNFAGSNFGATVYSLDDHRFPGMTDMMLEKVFQSRTLIDIVTNAQPDMRLFSELEARAMFKNTLRMVSASPHFDRSWQVIKAAWDSLTPEQQAKWAVGFDYINRSYIKWVKKLAALANGSDGVYAAVIEDLVDSVI